DSDDDIEVLRGDLLRILAEALPDTVATRFGDSPVSLTDGAAGADVRFASGRTERYDLVIGADGQHSAVRKLTFGPDADHVRHLGVYLALADHPGAAQSDVVNSIHNVPGRMAGLFRYHDKAVAVFQFRSGPIEFGHRDLDAQKKILVDAFAGR
ncbi:monooxygenase, partial [Mycobacterium sp. ITM-2017-0098]